MKKKVQIGSMIHDCFILIDVKKYSLHVSNSVKGLALLAMGRNEEKGNSISMSQPKMVAILILTILRFFTTREIFCWRRFLLEISKASKGIISENHLQGQG